MTRPGLSALAIVACLALTSPAAQADRSTGQHIDDSTIATSTKAAIAGESLGSAGAINVEVYKGTVQLAGFVSSEAERTAAIAAANTVKGAVMVLDAMAVLPGRRTAGQTLDDTAAQTRLKTALANQMGVEEALAINTEVRKGHVILSGFTTDAALRDQAGQIANGIAGVTEVHNAIAVEP